MSKPKWLGQGGDSYFGFFAGWVGLGCGLGRSLGGDARPPSFTPDFFSVGGFPGCVDRGVNMVPSLVDVLKRADRETLDEILREAESRLAAQLTSALAADGRAMNFLGFVAAIAVATIGASLAIIGSNVSLALIGLFVGLGMTVAAFSAFNAAKPIDFQMVGNYPSEWCDDVLAGATLKDSLAAQAAFYDEMLKANALAMATNADGLARAATSAKVTVLLGCIASVVYFVSKYVSSL
jgi:hypothetical protein